MPLTMSECPAMESSCSLQIITQSTSGIARDLTLYLCDLSPSQDIFGYCVHIAWLQCMLYKVLSTFLDVRFVSQ